MAGREPAAVPAAGRLVAERLPGGNLGGAVRVGDTVRRATGPWTPAVHALLRHLEAAGFDGAPRVLGIDEAGREVLTYLDGETVGDRSPWPAWVHGDAALEQAASWLRRYHEAVTGFVPPPDARWRLTDRAWRPGDVVAHYDAAPYNAVWRDGRLVGFVDWDLAGPATAAWDLAYAAFSWVPLHASHVVTAEGFADLAARPRRLAAFLDAYGATGSRDRFLDLVVERVATMGRDLRRMAAGGDPTARLLVERGDVANLDVAIAEIERDRAELAGG